MTDLRAYLRTLDAGTLADLLYEQAERDPGLRTRLRLRAGEPGGDLAEVAILLDGATPRRGPGPEPASSGEVAKIGAVLDTLQRLLDSGTQADVEPLARRAVDRIIKAMENTGGPGALAVEWRRAVGLYARACAAHPPDPERLADWLLGIEFGGSGLPRIEFADFAEALGRPGLGRLKSTVDSVLAEVPAAEADAMPEAAWLRRRTAERLNEQLAEISGDVDALLEILSGQLPRLDVSLKIVRVLRAAGRTTEAIAHAAQSLAQGSGPARVRLVNALADRASGNRNVPGQGAIGGARSQTGAKTVEETGRRDEVLALPRTEFERSPGLRTYRALREAATEPARWDAERERALGLLRERAGTDSLAADEFARVLLDEGRPEESWQAALRYDCSLGLKMELARLREAEHPADAIVVYKSHIEDLIEHKDAEHYRHAAKRLRKLRTLCRTAGLAEEFGDYLAGLVRTHRRKARLLAEIRNASITVPKP